MCLLFATFHLFINPGFRVSIKLIHGFLGLWSRALQRPGFFCPLVLSAFPWAPQSRLTPELPREQLHVSRLCDAVTVPSFQPSIAAGWLRCKWNNKQVLSGCTLPRSSLHVYPTQLPFPQALALFFFFFFLPPVCLFVVSFISCPAAPVKPQTLTHTPWSRTAIRDSRGSHSNPTLNN